MQIFDFPVIAAGEVAVISTRDILVCNGGGGGGGGGGGDGGGGRETVAEHSDLILQEALRSMGLQSASACDDTTATDTLLEDALKSVACKGGSSSSSDLD